MSLDDTGDIFSFERDHQLPILKNKYSQSHFYDPELAAESGSVMRGAGTG